MEFYLIEDGPRKKYSIAKLLNKVHDGINDELTRIYNKWKHKRCTQLIKKSPRINI